MASDDDKIAERLLRGREAKQRIFRKIYADITAGKQPNRKQRRFELVMGLPGSGKSSYTAKLQAEDPSLVQLDSDDFLRYHPAMKEIQKSYPARLNDRHHNLADEYPQLIDFAAEAYYYLHGRLEENGFSMVADALPASELVDLAEEMLDRGWKTKITLLTAPKQMLAANITGRFLANREQGSFHPQNRLMADIKSFREDIQYLAEGGLPVTVRNNMSDTILYQDDGTAPVSRAPEVFWQEYNRELNSVEKLQLNRQQYRLLSRAQTPYEKAVIKALTLPMPKTVSQQSQR